MAEAYKPINRSGLQLRPFYSYKLWKITDENFRMDAYKISTIRALSPDFNEKIPVSKSISGDLLVDDVQLKNHTSGSTKFLASKFQKGVWTSLKSAFYHKNINGQLYSTASVFSIPHNRLGDGVKPNTFKGVDLSSNTDEAYASTSYQITTSFHDVKIDEYHGYIVDSDLNSESYVNDYYLMGYWGFNEKILNRNYTFDRNISDGSKFKNKSYAKDIKYLPGIITDGEFTSSRKASGTKALLNGNTSYIRTSHNSHFDLFKSDSYSISIWTDLPPSQSMIDSDSNWIVSKAGTFTDYGFDKSISNIVSNTNQENPIYPFEIRVKNQTTSDNGKVIIGLSDGIITNEISSSTLINDGQHHIVFNKSNTSMELWIDGTLDFKKSINNLRSNIHNQNDILFGTKYISDATVGSISNIGSLSGSIDEVRLYKKFLTSTEIQSLSNNNFESGSAYQTSVIGQIFYKHGIAVVSDMRPKYKNIWLGQSGSWDYFPDRPYDYSRGFTTEYRSTKLLYETSVLCEIGADEFNVSSNPSLRPNNNIKSPWLKSYVTGSDFSTYITTIGLYNNSGELIAVGKLASPIKNRNDVDITVKVRFDLDGPFGTPKYSTEPNGKTPTLIENNEGNFVWNTSALPGIKINE